MNTFSLTWEIHVKFKSQCPQRVLLELASGPHLLRLAQFNTECLRPWKHPSVQGKLGCWSPGTQPRSFLYPAFALQWQSGSDSGQVAHRLPGTFTGKVH